MIYESLDTIPQEPGSYKVRLNVTQDVNGADIAVWVNCLVGAKPGPTLTLLSGLHGNEWLHLEFFRRFITSFDPTNTSGTVLAIPIANTVAFGTLSRYIAHDDGDTPDANRAFPGKGRNFTWIAEQIAETLAQRVFPRTNCLIDYHMGVWGHTMGSTIIGTDFSNPEVNTMSMRVAMAYGVQLIYATKMIGHWPGPRSSLSYIGEILGIPGMGCFLGGAGFGPELEETWLTDNLKGIENVMGLLGMRSGQPEPRERYLVYDVTHRLNPRVGGLLLPVHAQDQIGRPVQAGELLGRVVSPLTFDVLEELVAPEDGYLSYWARSYPIRPGDYAFGVVPSTRGNNRWVPGSM